jgi:DNA-binding MarR family transcriptional regulator
MFSGAWNRTKKSLGAAGLPYSRSWHAMDAAPIFVAMPKAKTAKAETPKIQAKKSQTAADFGLLPDILGYHLRRAQSAVFQDFAATMDGANVTPGQFGVLALIEANAGLSQTRLAEILGIDRSTLVAVIDKLEGQGLVERAARPNDRRSHALRLSREGQSRFETLAKLVKKHEARIARQLSASERKTLIDLLQRIG